MTKKLRTAAEVKFQFEAERLAEAQALVEWWDASDFVAIPLPPKVDDPWNAPALHQPQPD